MKYIIALFAIVSFASCKKDYTCTCTDKDNNEVYTHNYKIKKGDRSATEQACKGEEVIYSSKNPTLVPITCTLK